MDINRRTAHESGSGALGGIVARGWHRVLRGIRRPESLTDILQIVKSVIAATAAWWISVSVLHSDLPFLAPWTALLTVHATVYRSLSRGIQTTVASAVGVGLSFLVGTFLGVSVWTFAAAIFVGLLGARLSWIRDEGVAIATTAVFVLGSGFSNQEHLLLERVAEVAVGVVIGVIVNALVIPPVRDKQAARYVDSINRRMGDVLTNMADEFSSSWGTDRADSWFAETRSMSDELTSAWQMVRFARESRLGNPAQALHRVSPRRGGAGNRQGSASFEDILFRVDEGISHLRHLTRTLREATYASGEWDTRFRDRWVSIVRDAGLAIADPDADVEPLVDRLDDLSDEMSSGEGLPIQMWPVYGSLITSMRHILTIVDDVASAREAREHSGT